MNRRSFLRRMLAAFTLFCAKAHSATLDRELVESTSIASIGYDAAARRLEIEFRSGALYSFREVPVEIHAAFLRAESKGRFFARSIRGKYPHTRIER